MELKIYWTEFAKSELKNIFDYYRDNASLKIAQKITSEIVKSTYKLSLHPLAGMEEPLLQLRKQEFRFIVCKNYKILYSFNEKKNRIEIFDIFDIRQNPTKIKRVLK